MIYTLPTKAYDPARYGKPWICWVDFEESVQGEFNYGLWIGDLGQEGELWIEVKGPIVLAKGQKDREKPYLTAPDFGTLIGDTVKWGYTRIAARNILRKS